MTQQQQQQQQLSYFLDLQNAVEKNTIFNVSSSSPPDRIKMAGRLVLSARNRGRTVEVGQQQKNRFFCSP